MAPSLPPAVTKYVEELEHTDPSALVAVFDRHGYYLYASDNHDQAFGYTAADLLNMNLAQIVHKAEHHGAWALRTVSVFYSKPIRFSSRVVTRPGVVIGIAGTLRHIADPGGERYFITCVKPT